MHRLFSSSVVKKAGSRGPPLKSKMAGWGSRPDSPGEPRVALSLPTGAPGTLTWLLPLSTASCQTPQATFRKLSRKWGGDPICTGVQPPAPVSLLTTSRSLQSGRLSGDKRPGLVTGDETLERMLESSRLSSQLAVPVSGPLGYEEGLLGSPGPARLSPVQALQHSRAKLQLQEWTSFSSLHRLCMKAGQKSPDPSHRTRPVHSGSCSFRSPAGRNPLWLTRPQQLARVRNLNCTEGLALQVPPSVVFQPIAEPHHKGVRGTSPPPPMGRREAALLSVALKSPSRPSC